MAIEYAISAGEGTLIDYGVWSDPYDCDEVEDFLMDKGMEADCYWMFHAANAAPKADVEHRYQTGIILTAHQCRDDCETGR